MSARPLLVGLVVFVVAAPIASVGFSMDLMVSEPGTALATAAIVFVASLFGLTGT